MAEFNVYSNLKPCASTDRIVDLPQVTSCGPGPVSLPGAFISLKKMPILHSTRWPEGSKVARHGELREVSDGPNPETGGLK